MLLAVIARSTRLLLTVIFTAGGVALLVAQVRSVGTAEIAERLSQIGWGFALVLLLSGGRLLFRSVAWRSLMARPRPITSTLAATIAGEALGNLTVLNLAASEPTKAVVVGSDDGAASALAALTAENFFYSVSVALYVVAGTAAMLVAYGDDLPARLTRAGVAALAVMAVVLAGAAWLAWQRPNILSALVRRLPIRRLSAFADRVSRFEAATYTAAGGRRQGLATMLTCEAAFHALSFLESWLTVWLLTGVSAPLAAFVLDTANRVVNVVFRWVPMRAGVDEVTSESVALAIALPMGVGTAMGLVRKARVLAWAAVGLAILAGRARKPLR